MKILGEELTGIGRWYIVLPPILLVGFLTGLYLSAAAGQARLNAANVRMRDSQERQESLGEFLALITNAESSERGYLLTGAQEYLQVYSGTVQKITPSLERLSTAYGAKDNDSVQLQELRVLTGKKLGELEDSIALYKQRGAASAVSVVRTDVGKRNMDAILKLVGAMRTKETADLSNAIRRWHLDLTVSRWVTGLGAAINLGLLALATVLVVKYMRRRSRQAENLLGHSANLERPVAARTRDLSLLLTHVHGVAEQEKSALARRLHDELGGQLVAARMDLSWLQQRVVHGDAAIEQRFKRIHDSLHQGIDLKRRVVEELRPTLLDNMGLFTALRWQFEDTCARAGLVCSEALPVEEIRFDAVAAIGVYRIAQEALKNVIQHSEAKSVALDVAIVADQLIMRISDDGKGIDEARMSGGAAFGLIEMRHRVAAMGGSWEIGRGTAGGTVAVVRVPLLVLRGAAA